MRQQDGTIQFATGGMQGAKIKPYVDNLIKYLKENHGFKPKERGFTGGCITAGMSMTNTFCLGEGKVLLAGETAGFLNLIGENISSAITTGPVAGEAVIWSLNSGKTVMDEYLPFVDKEKAVTLRSIEIGKNFGF
jgi:flavin-dependent dehydrogenase